MNCAFLTIADLSDFVSDDELAADLLRQRGWRVATLPWDQPCDWDQFDLVIIRTTWDYHERPGRFMQVLQEIEHSDTALHNSRALAGWNMDKGYLRDLEAAGVPIVPTLFEDRFSGRDALFALYKAFDTDEIILKPQIGANAVDTFHIPRGDFQSFLPRLEAAYSGRPFMAQPFMPHIKSEGEYSLIYLNGAFSHAILKTPTPGDFRVQEEHGGIITAAVPEAALLDAGQRAMDALHETPLYARVDLVRHKEDDFRIMEFELVEPSLYLRMDADAPRRFVDALTAVL